MIKDITKIVKGFDWNRVSWRDKEYLSNMVKETVNERSVKNTGIPFNQTYTDAGDFALLMWVGTAWRVLELGNDADGATAPGIA